MANAWYFGDPCAWNVKFGSNPKAWYFVPERQERRRERQKHEEVAMRSDITLPRRQTTRQQFGDDNPATQPRVLRQPTASAAITVRFGS